MSTLIFYIVSAVLNISVVWCMSNVFYTYTDYTKTVKIEVLPPVLKCIFYILSFVFLLNALCFSILLIVTVAKVHDDRDWFVKDRFSKGFNRRQIND